MYTIFSFIEIVSICIVIILISKDLISVQHESELNKPKLVYLHVMQLLEMHVLMYASKNLKISNFFDSE